MLRGSVAQFFENRRYVFLQIDDSVDFSLEPVHPFSNSKDLSSRFMHIVFYRSC